MDVIHLLPDTVANQIAAGEVIQRPASCLKELVENSLDAGATHIRVIVKDAGRTLLQVVDNGSGMSETDVRMAFERHATSKIRSAQDLFSLHTMGFRGEALPSISAVAHVEVQTRRPEDEVGTLLEIAGGEVLGQSLCQCPVGTNIKVKDLFYNVPVRRKFLKTDQTELRNLLTAFYHIVLVYPKVQFTFVSNDEILMDLPAATEKQRIESVFGKTGGKPFTSQLVEIAADTELVSIRGFVGKPEAAGKNAQQYFFVNGRYMRHPYFHKAVMNAYSGMLPGELMPSYFIYFDILPEAIDVNIHPTKTEIKFQDEQAVFQILLAAVREALGKFNIAPAIDFNRDGELEMPVKHTTTNELPKVTVDPNYNPFRQHNDAIKQQRVPATWNKLYDEQPDFEPKENELFPLGVDELPMNQYAEKYIVVNTQRGLLFVNQHRAHICVLYNQLLDQINESHGISQQLLFQDVWELSADDMVLMNTLSDDLRAVGFDLVQFGQNSYSIAGVPAIMKSADAIAVLKDIVDDVRLTGSTAREQWRKRIALVLAGKAAIPYGQRLLEDEMRSLIRELTALTTYRLTPDGKTVAWLLTDDELQKHF